MDADSAMQMRSVGLMITSDELIRVARLAKLSLTAEDADALMIDMTNIIGIVQSIDDADTALLDCTGDNEAASLREDAVIPPLPAELILKNAAIKRDGYFAATTATATATTTATATVTATAAATVTVTVTDAGENQ